jgi:hypothetical protein
MGFSVIFMPTASVCMAPGTEEKHFFIPPEGYNPLRFFPGWMKHDRFDTVL